MGGADYCGAVKNNSRRTFFEFREIAFEVLSEDVKELFKNISVRSRTYLIPINYLEDMLDLKSVLMCNLC